MNMQYPYPLFDENKKVVCQICGKSYLVISPPHLRTHDVSYDEYQNRFPDAPLSSKEFIKRGKLGKQKDDVIINEEIIVEEEVDVILEFQKSEVQKLDPMMQMKRKILNHLKYKISPNVEMDYLIQQYGTDGKLKFEFITDFCDPMLKVVIQFPNTFWHNHDLMIDLNKTVKLEQYGWKVIKIASNDPSYDLLNEAIEKQN